MPINDILKLSEWKASQANALSGDPLEDTRRYGDYLRITYDSRNELDEDKRNEIDSSLYNYAKNNNLLAEEESEEAKQEQFFTRPVSSTDVKLVRDNISKRTNIDPATVTAFDEYQSLYEKAQTQQPYDKYAFDSAKEKVDTFLTRDEVAEARRAAVKRGDLLATTYEDSLGNTQIEVSDTAETTDPELLRASIKNNLGTFDTRALPLLYKKLQKVDGLNVNYFQFERANDAVSTIEKLSKEENDFAPALEKVRDAVTGGFGQKVTELIQIAPDKEEAMAEAIGKLKSIFPTDYSEQEIRTSIDDYVKLTSERKFDPADPKGSFKTLSTGQILAPTSLLLNAKEHDRLVDKLDASPEAKQLVKDQRVTQLESLAPEIIKTASEASSKFSDYYAKEKDAGQADTDIINKWFGNKQNYNQFANWAETVGGGVLFEGIVGLAAYPLAMAGNSTAREGLIKWQKESAANRQYASYFGSDFGLGTEILEQIIPVGIDTVIAIAAGSASAGTGAAAYVGGKAVLKAGMRNTLRTALVESGTKALVDESLVKAGLAGLRAGVKKSAVTALEKEGLVVTGQNIIRKASEQTTQLITRGAINATAFTRSAGGNFLSTYTALKEQTNKDGTPKYTESEIYSNALTSGLVSGAITVGVMSAFKWLGAEGVESLANRGLSLRQMKRIYDVNRGRLAGLGAQVAGLAPSGAPQLVAETFEAALNQSIRQAATSIVKAGMKEAAGEGLEEAIDETANSITNDILSKRDVNVGKAIDSGLRAGAYGLAFGAAAGVKKIGISDQISASQVGAEAMAALSNQENTLTAIANKMESTGLTQAAGFIRNRIGVTRQTGISMADQIRATYERQAAGTLPVAPTGLPAEPTGIAPIGLPAEPTGLPAEPTGIAPTGLPAEPTGLPAEPTGLPAEPTGIAPAGLPAEPTAPIEPAGPLPVAGPELRQRVATTYGLRAIDTVDPDELRIATQSRTALESSGQLANAEKSTEFLAKRQATAQTQRAELEQYGLNDGIQSFFQNIARTHPNKSYAKLAKVLLDVPNAFEGFTVDVIDAPYEPYAGLFMPKSKRILINAQVDSGRGGIDSSLHEMLHAATEHAIVNPTTAAQKKAVESLDKLRKLIKTRSLTLNRAKTKQLEIGLNSVSEFVTYTYTSPEFQKLVNDLTPTDSVPFMRRIWGAIAKVVTGKSDVALENALRQIGDLVTLANPRAFDRTLINAPVTPVTTAATTTRETRASIGEDVGASLKSIPDIVEAIRAGRTDTALKAVNEVVTKSKELERRIEAESQRRKQDRRVGAASIIDNITRQRVSGRIDDNEARALTEFVNKISPTYLADVAVSIKKGAGGTTKGTYDFIDSIVTLYTENNKKVSETGFHEFAHSLSRYLPDSELAKVEATYKRELVKKLKTNPEYLALIGRYSFTVDQYEAYAKFVEPAALEKLKAVYNKNGTEIVSYDINWSGEDYRFHSVDEWFAENMRDLIKQKQSVPNTFAGKMAKAIREFLQLLKARVGGDVYTNFYNNITDTNLSIKQARSFYLAPTQQIFEPESARRRLNGVLYSIGEDANPDAGRVPLDHATLAEYATTGGVGIRNMSPATTLQVGDKIEMSHTNITLGRLSRIATSENGLLDPKYPAGIMPFSLKPAGAGKQNVINARLSNSKVKLDNLTRTEFVTNAKSFALDRDASIEDVLAAVNETLNRGKLLGINMTDFKLTNPEISKLETIPAGTVVYAQGAKTVIGGPTGTLESFNEPINVRELDPEEWTAIAYNPALGNYMYPVTLNEDGSLSFETDQKFLQADEVVLISDMGQKAGLNFGIYARNMQSVSAVDELKTADAIKEQLQLVEPTLLTIPEVRASISADEDIELPAEAIDKAVALESAFRNGESGASLEDQNEQVRELLSTRMSYAGEFAVLDSFRRDSMDAARAMAASGIDSEVVRNITGWFTGMYDGKLRWEIPDQKATLNEKVFLSLKDKTKFKTAEKKKEAIAKGYTFEVELSEVFNHPELFAAYPDLRNVKFKRESYSPDPKKLVHGWFDRVTGTLHVTPYATDSLSTLLHEIQHWIQRKEGFASGSAPDYVVDLLTNTQLDAAIEVAFKPLTTSIASTNEKLSRFIQFLDGYQNNPAIKKLADNYRKVASNGSSSPQDVAIAEEKLIAVFGEENRIYTHIFFDSDVVAELKIRISSLKQYIAKEEEQLKANRDFLITPARKRSFLKKSSRFLIYTNVAGEIEARDIQARALLTPLQLAYTAPYSTDNIAVEDSFAFNVRASIGISDNPYSVREVFSHNEIARMTFDSVPVDFKLRLMSTSPTYSEEQNESMDRTLMAIEPDQRDIVYFNPTALQKVLQNVTPFSARNMIQGMVNHELIHIETLNEFSISEIASIGKRLPEKYTKWLTRQYYGDVQTTGAKDETIAKDIEADEFNELNVGAEFIRRKVEEIVYGRSSEYSDGYWKSNPKERERLMSALDRGLTKIRARFNARPDLDTADRIAKIARAFRREQSGIYGPKPAAILTTDALADNAEFQQLLETGFSDQTNFQLPLMSIGADVNSDNFWNRMTDKLTNNLTPEMRVMIADRNAQLSRVAFRIERFDKQFRKMFPAAEASGVSIQDVRDALGSTADTVSIEQRKELEQYMLEFTATLSDMEPDLDPLEFADRVTKERAAKWRSYRVANNEALAVKRNTADQAIRNAGHPVFAELLADMRLQIDNESNEIRNKKNLSGHMQLVIEDNMGLYLTRSYQFFSNEAWALAAQNKEAATIRAADGSVIDFGQLRADAASEFKQQLLEEADAAGIELTEEELNTRMMDRLDNYLKELTNSSPNIPITMNKLKQDLSSLMPRAGVTEKFRALLGEVDSPLANAAVTLKNVSRIQINDTFDKKMANYLVQAGLASTNSSTGVPIFSKSAGTAYGALSGLYADPKIAQALQAEFGVNGKGIQSETDKLVGGAGKVLLGLSGLSLTAKTLGSFGFYSRNFVSSIFFFGGMQGIVPNGKLADAYKIAFNTSFSGKTTSEQAAVIDELIELGLLKDDAQSRSVTDVFRGFVQNADGELDRLVQGINTAINGDHAQAATLLNLTKTAKNSLGTAVDVGAGINDTMDSAIKVQAYFVELETLKKAYASDSSWTETRLKREAAAIVKRTFPTHSQVFPLVRSFNNSTASLFIAPFLRFKAETARVFVNTYKQALLEIKTENPTIKRRGARRLVGAITTTFGTSSALAALYSGIFSALASEDEENASFVPVTGDAAFALRSALPDWQSGHRLFVKLASGDVSIIDMTSIDAFSIIKDPLMLAMKPDTGDIDPKLVGSYIAKQLVGGQIAAGTALEVLQNKTDRGDVIWDTNTDSALAVIGKAMKHYYSGAIEIGMLSKGMDVAESLKASGRAEDEGRVFRASEIILGEILGARPRRLALDDVAYRSMRGAKESLDNATKARSAINSSRELSDDVISKTVSDYNDSTDKLQANLLRRMDGLEALGLDMDTVVAKGRSAGFSKLRLYTALDNTNVRWTPSKEFYSDMAKRLKPEILDTRINQIQKAVSEHESETTLR